MLYLEFPGQTSHRHEHCAKWARDINRDAVVRNQARNHWLFMQVLGNAV